MSKPVTSKELDDFIKKTKPSNDTRFPWLKNDILAYRIARDLKALQTQVREALQKGDLSELWLPQDDKSEPKTPATEENNG